MLVGAGLYALSPANSLPVAFLTAGGIVAVWVLSSTQRSLLAATAVSILIPFAVVPARLVATPSVLELALAVALAGWLLAVLYRGDTRLPTLALPVLLLSGTLTAAFVAGSPTGYTSDTFHNFFKLQLGLMATPVVASLSGTHDFARKYVQVAVASGLIAATVGLTLYFADSSVTERILKSLSIVGYPTERVLRYVEDNPALGLRATGLAVDPNSFGGMLALLLPLAASQSLARRPWIHRGIALTALVTMTACLLLTRSRAAWLGASAGLVFLSVVRYRRLWLPILTLGILVTMFGLGSEFLDRLQQGFALQDPATLMRVREYNNALAIISRYPMLGIGFGSSPDPDLHPGVSSIYLTIAETSGFLGLGAFLAFASVAMALLVRSWFTTRHTDASDVVLGLLTGTIVGLSVGLLDHYFMNPAFSHMAFVLWSYPAVASGLPLGLKVDDRKVVHAVGRSIEANTGPGVGS